MADSPGLEPIVPVPPVVCDGAEPPPAAVIGPSHSDAVAHRRHSVGATTALPQVLSLQVKGGAMRGSGLHRPTAPSPRLLVRSGPTRTHRDLLAKFMPPYCMRVDHPARQMWNVARLVMILFYVIICPLRLCLADDHRWQPTILVDYLVADLFFLLTIAANLFSFVPAHKAEVWSRREITREYLSGRSSSRLRVAIDLLASMPIDLFGYFALIQHEHGYSVVYALRMMKLLHVFSVFDLCEQLPTRWPSLSRCRRGESWIDSAPHTRHGSNASIEMSLVKTRGQLVENVLGTRKLPSLSSASSFNGSSTATPRTRQPVLTLSTLRNVGLKPIWKIIATYFLLMHLYACLWSLLTVRSRLTTSLDVLESTPQRYLEALYFVVVTLGCVGFGDVTPINLNEVALTMLIQLSGFLCIGGLIAFIVPLLAQSQAAETANQDQTAAWMEVFEDNAIPTEVRHRILDYYRYMSKRQRGAPEDQLLADEHLIPSRYRTDILMNIFGRTLMSMPFLAAPATSTAPSSGDGAAPLGLVRALIARMHPTTYCAGDIILFCGQRNDRLFVLARGDVAVVTLQENSSGEVVETSATLRSRYFGLESFLRPEVRVQADYQVVDALAERAMQAATTKVATPSAKGVGRRRSMARGSTQDSRHSHPWFQGGSQHSTYCDVFTLEREEYATIARAYPGFTLEAVAARDPTFDADLYASERAATVAATAVPEEVKKDDDDAALDDEETQQIRRVNTAVGANPLASVGSVAVQQELARHGEFQTVLSVDPSLLAAAASTAAMPPPPPSRSGTMLGSKRLVAGQTAGHRRRRPSSISDSGHLKKALAERERCLAEVAEAEESDSDEEQRQRVAPAPVADTASVSDFAAGQIADVASLSVRSFTAFPVLPSPQQPSFLRLLLCDPAALVDHTSVFRRVWDSVMLLLLFYTFIVVPLQAAFYNHQLVLQQVAVPYSVVFETAASKTSSKMVDYVRIGPSGVSVARIISTDEWVWLAFSWLIDACFMIDILLRCRKFKSAADFAAESTRPSVLGTDADEAEIERDQNVDKTTVKPQSNKVVDTTPESLADQALLEQARTIGVHYRRTWQFAADLIAAIPLEVIIAFGVSSEWLYILRLNRLVRLHRFSYLLSRFEGECLERFSRGFGWIGPYLTMVKMALYAVLFCHVVGCCWFLLSYMLTWHGNDSTWIWSDGIIHAPVATQYLRSFFFVLVTCTTTGYGGIVPRCNGEYVFVIFLVLVGVSMYVSLLASLTVSAENRNADSHASEQFLQILRQYFRTRNVDLKVRERCLQYYHHQGNTMNQRRREDALINSLPALLKIELLAPLMAGAFLGLPLFVDFSDEFLDMLLSHLESRTYAPGDVISRVGERSNEMFFIHRGTVDVRVAIAGRMRTIKTMQAEDSFGTECLLHRVAPERVRDPATYTAQAICTVFVLTKRRFDLQVAYFPDDHDLILTKRAQVHETSAANASPLTNATSPRSQRTTLQETVSPSHMRSPSHVSEEGEPSRPSHVSQSHPAAGSSSSSSESDDDDANAARRRHMRNYSQGSAGGISMTRLLGGRRAPSYDLNALSPAASPVLAAISMGVEPPDLHRRLSSHSSLLAGALSSIMKSKTASATQSPDVGPQLAEPFSAPPLVLPSSHVRSPSQPPPMPPPPPPQSPPEIPAPDTSLESSSIDVHDSVADAVSDLARPAASFSSPVLEKGGLRHLQHMHHRSSTLRPVEQPAEMMTPISTNRVSDVELMVGPAFRTAEDAAELEQDVLAPASAVSTPLQLSPLPSKNTGSLRRKNAGVRPPPLNRGGSVPSISLSSSAHLRQGSLSRNPTVGHHVETAASSTDASASASPPSVHRFVSLTPTKSLKHAKVPIARSPTSVHMGGAASSPGFVPVSILRQSTKFDSAPFGDTAANANSSSQPSTPKRVHTRAGILRPMDSPDNGHRASDVGQRLHRHQATAARFGTMNWSSFSLPSDAAAGPPMKRVLTRMPTSHTVGDEDTDAEDSKQVSASRTSTMHRTSTHHSARRFATNTRLVNASSYKLNGSRSRTLTKGLLRSETLATLATDDGDELSLMMIPNSLFRNVWSFIGGIAILWFLVVVPFRIAFEAPLRHSWSPIIAAAQVATNGTVIAGAASQDESNSFSSTDWSLSPTIYVDSLFDLFFLVDIVLRLNWFSYFENGVLISHPKSRLRAHYARTTLKWDVVGTLVLDLLVLLIGTKFGVWLLYWLRLLRLLRLHRVRSHLEVAYRFLEHYCGFKNLSLLTIAVQCALLAVAVHWLACGWYLVGLARNSPTSWLSQRDAPVYAINTHDQHGMSLPHTYSLCVYFILVTMSTTGYGDIEARTYTETWFCVLVIFIGLVLYASVTATIASLAANFDVAIGSFQQEFDNVKSFAERKELPPELRKKISAYYRGMWAQFKGKNEQEILQSLPVILREDISFSLYGDLLVHSGLFSGGAVTGSAAAAHSPSGSDSVFKLPFLRRLSSLLVYRSFVDGEVVFRKDEYVHYAVFVKHGCLDAFEVRTSQLPPRSDSPPTGEPITAAEGANTHTATTQKETLVHRYTKNMIVNPDLLMVLPASKSKHGTGAVPKLLDEEAPLIRPVPMKQTRTLRAFHSVVGVLLHASDLHGLLLLYPQVRAALRRNILGMMNSRTGFVRQGNTLSMMADAKKAALAREKQERRAQKKAHRHDPSKPREADGTETVVDVGRDDDDDSDEDDHEDDNDDDDDDSASATSDNEADVASWCIPRDSSFRLRWDLFALAFVLIYLISIPILVAFTSSSSARSDLPWHHPFGADMFWPLLVVTYFLDVFFWCDLYLHLRRFARSKDADIDGGSTSDETAATNPALADAGIISNSSSSSSSTARLTPSEITHDYLFRRRYGIALTFVECVASMPWDVIALIVSAANNSPHMTMQAVSLLRLCRVLYFARIGTYLESLDLYLERAKLTLNFQLQRIIKLSVMIVIVLHWMSCGWYLLGRYPYHGPGGIGFGDDSENVSWLNSGYKSAILLAANTWGHYLWSLYWAISTITTTGFGDIAATNQGELLLNMVMILGGDIVYGAIIGGMCVNAANAHAPVAHYTDKIQGLMSYMTYRRTPASVQKRILLYHRHIWSSTQGLDVHDDRVVHRALPANLSVECQFFVHAPILRSVPFFRSCSTLFLSHIACILRERTFLAGETVYRQGDVGQCMCILKEGEMRVNIRRADMPASGAPSSASDVVSLPLLAPSIFGDVSFFMGTVRTAHVLAVDTCLVLELDRAEFESRLAFFPNYKKDIMQKFVDTVFPNEAGHTTKPNAPPPAERRKKHRMKEGHRQGEKTETKPTLAVPTSPISPSSATGSTVSLASLTASLPPEPSLAHDPPLSDAGASPLSPFDISPRSPSASITTPTSDGTSSSTRTDQLPTTPTPLTPDIALTPTGEVAHSTGTSSSIVVSPSSAPLAGIVASMPPKPRSSLIRIVDLPPSAGSSPAHPLGGYRANRLTPPVPQAELAPRRPSIRYTLTPAAITTMATAITPTPQDDAPTAQTAK